MYKKRFYPRAYPAWARSTVFIDYASKLTSAQKTWLATFNESEYGGNPDLESEITKKPVTQKQRRKKWREQKRQSRDALSNTNTADLFEESTHAINASIYHEDVVIDLIDGLNELKQRKKNRNE